MPVPIVAPTPNSVSWNSPIVRASSPSPGVRPGLGGHHADRLASEQLLRAVKRRGISGCTAAIELLLVFVPHAHPLAKRRRWQPSRAPTCEPRFGVSNDWTHARGRERIRHVPRHRDAARDLGDPRVLPHQPDADLLRLADRVQPARHRPLGAQLLLRQLLRLVRGHATRACSCRRSGRTASSSRWRTSATTCSRTRRSSTASRARGPGGKAVFVMFDEETEALAAAAGPRGRASRRPSCATGSTRRSSRPSSANEAGVPSAPNTLGRATSYEELRALADVRRPRRRPRRPDAVRRLGQDDVLHPRPSATGTSTPSDIVDQELKVMKRINNRAVGRRGRAHPPRHDRRAVDDRPHRPPGADAAQGRLVRQRHLPRGALARAPRARARAHRSSSATGSPTRATAASSRSTTSPTSTPASSTSASSTRASAA